MTLVEVLATLVIVSIVIIFLVGIQVVVQKQFKSQTTSTEQLTDITIAMKSITKELRLAEEVSANESELLIQLAPDEQVSYVLQEDTLQRNDSDYIHEINPNHFFVKYLLVTRKTLVHLVLIVSKVRFHLHLLLRLSVILS